ncbi:precorrin-3B synthase [Paracoccus sulfuroxidans]|uniref:Precorrin-3B synthase n=1 Tax=Paracoccus sulfuroxidans TaxID=384678 RepID=A0A562NQY0_9RHOB|nr:precorrin-3B synthase [Paracoccus sulfuroxidans]TWI34533.1 precorrin-3B synthase [Paracoccus sulfuroxidans]
MSGFQVKGWCPGALRPMRSGDGLVLRIRAHCGRLTPAQAMGIADLSQTSGNGLMDLTSRANLQLRGLDEAGHAAALERLDAMGLLDPDARTEARRNVILSPLAPMGSPAWQIAEAISAGLAGPDAPEVPTKFGFAVDALPLSLGGVPADIRLIPSETGWVVAPDGADWALPTDDPAALALDLARDFIARGGVTAGRGRMRDRLPPMPEGAVARPETGQPPAIGPVPGGWLLGFAFGQITPDQLRAAAAHGPLRLTPWRALLIEGLALPPRVPGAILVPDDPLLRIHACTGAPACPQGLADVRALARRLAPGLRPGQSLHVSGCAKGCAHRGRADVTLVARSPDTFDMIRDGTIRDAALGPPLRTADIPPL